MDQKQFQSLLRYYLSCMDAEEAAQLKLRKNQEYKTYIFVGDHEEQLFANDLPQLEVPITDHQQKLFIEKKAANAESLIDLYYGYPVFVDEKDMLCPLFFMEAEANSIDGSQIQIMPKAKRLFVNRMHLIKEYDAEEIQRICEELEGEFGSFEARLKAAENYIPSLKKKTGG